MHIRSFARHVVGITFQALILAAIVAALAFGAVLVTGAPGGSTDALAAKGGNRAPSDGGTMNLVLVSDPDGNGTTDHGDVITFTGSTTATNKPMVGVRCWQGATMVLDGYVALFDTWLSKEITLNSSSWNSTADAACFARMFYYDNRSRERVLATMNFTVAP